jgi:acyl-coenzyme A thioesterase PaaI-like protein
MTAFSTLMSQLADAPDGSTLTVTEDWAQGRTLFGGISAALCATVGQQKAAEGREDGAPPLRSGQFAFIGPASGPLRLSAEVLRRGKSTVFVQADLFGEAGLAARALLTFGAARPSAIDDLDLTAPATVAPDDCPPLHGRSGSGPNFIANFEIRPADGVAIFSREAREADNRPDLLLWARHKDQTRRLAGSGRHAAAGRYPVDEDRRPRQHHDLDGRYPDTPGCAGRRNGYRLAPAAQHGGGDPRRILKSGHDLVGPERPAAGHRSAECGGVRLALAGA